MGPSTCFNTKTEVEIWLFYPPSGDEKNRLGGRGYPISAVRCDAMRRLFSFFEFSGAKQRRRELDQIIIIEDRTHTQMIVGTLSLSGITGGWLKGKIRQHRQGGLCDISVPKRRVPGTSYHVHKLVQSNPMIRAFIIS